MFFDNPDIFKVNDMGEPEPVVEQEIIGMIDALRSAKEGELKPLHDRIRYRRDRYFLDHYKGKGKAEQGEERLIFADEMRLVDTSRNLLMLKPPTIKARPEHEDMEALAQSDQLEAWLRGVLYKQRIRSRQDPLDIFALQMLRDGVGVLFTYWEVGLDSRYSEQGGYNENAPLDDLPIVIQARDPLTIFPQEGAVAGRWDWVMVVEEVPVFRVEQQWRVQLEQFRGKKYKDKLTDKVKVVDVWSQEVDPLTGEPMVVNAVIVAGSKSSKMVKPPTLMANYETLPFEIGFCIETGEADWLRKGLPITAAIEQIVPQKASLRNSLVRIVKMLAQFPPVFTGKPGRAAPKLAAGFGEVIHLETGETLDYPKPPAQSPDIYKVDGMFDDEVALGGMGSPVSQPAGRSMSGYAVALSGQAGTLKMVSPARSFSLALTNALQQVCNLAANFAPDHEMTVMGELEGQRKPFTLTGTDCRGFLIDVDVSARFPDDEARSQAMGVTLATAPQKILDSRTILQDFLGYENVQEIQQRILVEKAMEDPAVMSVMIQVAAETMGLTEYLERERPAPPQGQPGMASPPGPPSMAVPVRGVPTQLMPQEQMGAMRSQEAGIGPKGRYMPQEMEEEYGPPVG